MSLTGRGFTGFEPRQKTLERTSLGILTCLREDFWFHDPTGWDQLSYIGSFEIGRGDCRLAYIGCRFESDHPPCNGIVDVAQLVRAVF